MGVLLIGEVATVVASFTSWESLLVAGCQALGAGSIELVVVDATWVAAIGVCGAAALGWSFRCNEIGSELGRASVSAARLGGTDAELVGAGLVRRAETV